MFSCCHCGLAGWPVLGNRIRQLNITTFQRHSTNHTGVSFTDGAQFKHCVRCHGALRGHIGLAKAVMKGFPATARLPPYGDLLLLHQLTNMLTDGRF